jgi:DBC1
MATTPRYDLIRQQRLHTIRTWLAVHLCYWKPCRGLSSDTVILQANPAALIATAKRTFKDATGVDLSACTRWYTCCRSDPRKHVHSCCTESCLGICELFAAQGLQVPCRVHTLSAAPATG